MIFNFLKFFSIIVIFIFQISCAIKVDEVRVNLKKDQSGTVQAKIIPARKVKDKNGNGKIKIWMMFQK